MEQRHWNQKWAEFRLSVIGGLLSSPPERGLLRQELRNLSQKQWQHPLKAELVRFSYKTIEEWYYNAKNSDNPIEQLRSKVRSDIGYSKLTDKLKELIVSQYKAHRSWSYQLHYDNLQVSYKKIEPESRFLSYSTIKRFMKQQGLTKQKRIKNRGREGFKRTEEHFDTREVRSYEVPYVSGLWHLDFHFSSRQITDEDGTWKTPVLFCVLDDHSRLICHLQWYYAENCKNLVHGVIQAIQKRNLPRAIMSDNGKAMLAREFREGLSRLSIVHETTLPYSPHQNGKQENLWGQIEGRLLPMLESYKCLSLKLLNDATIAWAEIEYNKKFHSEIETSPVNRYMNGKDVSRPSPNTETLKNAFRKQLERKVRRSDGTISIDGKRFEVPARFSHLSKLSVQYTFWDLSNVHIVDDRSGKLLSPLFPLDKQKNSEKIRRTTESPLSSVVETKDEIAPLLKKLISEYAATGLMPAYIPQNEQTGKDKNK